MDVATHAVYSRFPTETSFKIYALLTPSKKQVSYTPTGMYFLHLTKNNLLSYEQMVSLLAVQKDRFVCVPYIKGRTEEEIKALIRSNPVIDTSNIKDLNVTDVPIYKGKYGKLEPNKFEKDGVKIINLTFVPSNTQHGMQLAQLCELGTDFGEVEIDCFVEAIVISNVKMSNITEGIYLLTIAPDAVTSRGKKEENLGHSLVLTIDYVKGFLEVFDSNGPDSRTEIVYKWTDKLHSYLLQKGIALAKIYTKNEPFLPQSISTTSSLFKGEEQCLVWAYWYIELLLLDEYQENKVIRQYLQELDPSIALDKLKRIATLMYL